MLPALDSPASLITLSITCKSLAIILQREVANVHAQGAGKYRKDLLQLLEKEWGDKYYFCTIPCLLRPFPSDATISRYQGLEWKALLISGCRTPRHSYWQMYSAWEGWVQFGAVCGLCGVEEGGVCGDEG